MDFFITRASTTPLYTQIAQYIKQQILAGVLKNGDLLPSVRVLSRDLKVSAITTRRAYSDLEAEGFVKSIPAKGTFVSLHHLERLRELGLLKLDDKLREALQIAKMLNLSEAEVTKIFQALYHQQ